MPERLAKQVSKKSVPKLELPTELNGNRDAFESFRRLNNMMAGLQRADLAELLLKRGETGLHSTPNSAAACWPSSTEAHSPVNRGAP